MTKRKKSVPAGTEKIPASAAIPDGQPPEESTSPSLRLESTQMWSPIQDVVDGIIVTKNGSYAQALEIAPINLLLFPEQDQHAIANRFGSAMQVFPPSFQIKILSRKAVVASHIQDIKRAQGEESNEACRIMQSKTIEKIQNNARNSISRRYYFIHTYHQEPGLTQQNWETVRSSMYYTSMQIASALSSTQFTNALASGIGDSQSQMDVLYQSMCRGEAEEKPFRAKAEEVCLRYSNAGKLEHKDSVIPVNDFIAPSYLDFHNHKYIEVDGKYLTIGYIEGNSFPGEVVPGWMSNLLTLGAGIDVDIFVQKRDTDEVRRKLPLAMQLNEADLDTKSSTSMDFDTIGDKLFSARYIRRGISNRETLFNFSVVLTISADSPSELRWKLSNTKEELLRIGVQYHPYTFVHADAFNMVLPLCQPNDRLLKNAKRNILNGDFGALYPFIAYEVNDRGGFMLGRSKTNLSPVFLNLFDRNTYSSGNAVILGSTGVGKTYSLQVIAMGLRQLGIQTIIIAPDKGFEYRPACLAIGGSYIPLNPGSPFAINIMEIRKHEFISEEQGEPDSVQSSFLSAKIQVIHGWISLIYPNMTASERQALDEALTQTYAEYGIKTSNDSLLDPANPGCYKKMPILEDLYRHLSVRRAGKGIQEALYPWVYGSAKSFNGPTNVNLDNQYIVIDVSATPKALLPAVTYIANDYTSSVIRADTTKPKAVLNDELQRMIGIAGSSEAAEQVLTNYKTVRAFNAIYISATQDTNDFFALNNGVYGKGILANAKIKLIMKQEEEEAKTISSILGLSDTELQHIQFYERGEALLISNRNHAEVKIVASEYEDSLINTDPDTKQRIAKSMPKEASDHAK